MLVTSGVREFTNRACSNAARLNSKFSTDDIRTMQVSGSLTLEMRIGGFALIYMKLLN